MVATVQGAFGSWDRGTTGFTHHWQESLSEEGWTSAVLSAPMMGAITSAVHTWQNPSPGLVSCVRAAGTSTRLQATMIVASQATAWRRRSGMLSSPGLVRPTVELL